MTEEAAMKKIVLIAALFFAILPGSAFAANEEPIDLSGYFPPDMQNHWAKETMADFLQSGAVNGYANSDGTVSVKPERKITRAEFVTMLARAHGWVLAGKPGAFKDVASKDFYFESVSTAYAKGIVDGNEDGTFAPNRSISRAEIAAMIMRTFNLSVKAEGKSKTFTDTNGSWAADFIDQASAAGIIDGYDDNTFKPGAKATRAQAMTMIYRALHKENAEPPKDEELTGPVLADLQVQLNTVNNGEYDQMGTRAAGYTNGFYRDSLIWGSQTLASLTAEGFKIGVVQKGTPVLDVTSKSDHYATVHVSGFSLDTTVSKDSSSHTETTPGEDTMYLRKLGNSWYIYGSASAFQGFN
jgi:hypothetical protein